ncbi:MAG: response regulator [Planctomycetes bacterium]|nr:response regulator [Planctomycetota bacterium]
MDPSPGVESLAALGAAWWNGSEALAILADGAVVAANETYRVRIAQVGAGAALEAPARCFGVRQVVPGAELSHPVDASIWRLQLHPLEGGRELAVLTVIRREDRARRGDQLPDGDDAVVRLAGGIAHDVNNLLSPILGYTEILRSDRGRPPEELRLLEKTHDAAAMLRELANHLLLLGRPSKGVSAVAIGRLLGELATRLRRFLDDRFEVEIRGEAPGEVLVEPQRLEPVLVDLAKRSARAMPDGGTIELAIAVRDGVCELAIRAVAERVVPTGARRGLVPLECVVERFGGSLVVDMPSADAVTFRVRLPLAAGIAAAASSAARRARVLVVEDNDLVRDFAVRVLANEGYRVVEAASGREAESRFAGKAEPLDLIITDVLLADIDGRSLVAKFRQRRPDLTALFITGLGDDAAAGTSTPGTDLLGKPFSAAGLLASVAQLLRAAGDGV